MTDKTQTFRINDEKEDVMKETLTQVFYSYHNIQLIVLSIISQSIDACHSSLRCSTGLLPAANRLCTMTARKEVNRHTKPAISTNGHHCMR